MPYKHNKFSLVWSMEDKFYIRNKKKLYIYLKTKLSEVLKTKKICDRKYTKLSFKAVPKKKLL